tara:strand:+ start:499 stop:630 length:132 start_codon:yes stop_codon:yes gene_type:complete
MSINCEYQSEFAQKNYAFTACFSAVMSSQNKLDARKRVQPNFV